MIRKCGVKGLIWGGLMTDIESNKRDTIDFNPHGGELDLQFYINWEQRYTFSTSAVCKKGGQPQTPHSPFILTVENQFLLIHINFYEFLITKQTTIQKNTNTKMLTRRQSEANDLDQVWFTLFKKRTNTNTNKNTNTKTEWSKRLGSSPI